MADSNNVVRGGLTSKHLDIPVLLHMLTYRPGIPDILPAGAGADGIIRYRPPVPEFHLGVLRGDRRISLRAAGFNGPVLALVLDGEVALTMPGKSESTAAPRGSAWLIPAAVSELTICLPDANTALVLAAPNLPFSANTGKKLSLPDDR
jgi:mannose-6-phosphate isomerase